MLQDWSDDAEDDNISVRDKLLETNNIKSKSFVQSRSSVESDRLLPNKSKKDRSEQIVTNAGNG